MHPFLFEVFGLKASSYGFFMLLGVAVAWFLVRHLAGGKKADNTVPAAFLASVCGAFVGAFLFRPLTRLPELMLHWEKFRGLQSGVVMGYLFGEFVFYGGLIGAGVALLVYCRSMNFRFDSASLCCGESSLRISPLPMADLFAPGVAVAHAFGRVGCYLAGCCYGVCVQSSHPFAVRFPAYPAGGTSALGGAPPGEPLLAVQLIEAACLFAITAILVLLYKKTAGRGARGKPSVEASADASVEASAEPSGVGITVCAYGILYSVTRFILEFYRGDLIRGVYGPFSTSQYVSIVLFCLSAFLLAKILCPNFTRKNTKPKNTIY